jgi:putative addiction module component (TIGR02574 family)
VLASQHSREASNPSLERAAGSYALAAAAQRRVRAHEEAIAVAIRLEETGGMRNVDFDINKLSIAERIQLAEDLWDSIPPEGGDVPLTEGQKAELDRRLDDLEQNPDAGESWEVVRARLHERLKRRE